MNIGWIDWKEKQTEQELQQSLDSMVAPSVDDAVELSKHFTATI